jgi:hypothetical protein
MARPRTRQSVRSGDPGAHRPLLLSSRRYTSDRDRLTVSALGARFATAKDVFLAAAFYDIPFCRALLAHVPREANRIRLVFNGLGGARLLTQRKELTELERALRKRIRSVEVRLAFEPGLFHTKLLLIRQPRKLTAFVGSANATMAAMSLNEEILLEVSGEGPIESYADRIWASSTPLAELSERLTAKTLIAFFRTGSLYFKPTDSLQITINPFTELLSSLSDKERKRLGTVRLPHSDQETGVGAFNLRRAVGFSDARRDAEDRERSKASVKPYAVETCFGYWVPRAVDAVLQETVHKARTSKHRRLVELRDALEATGSKTLVARYAEYVSAVGRLLDNSGVSVRAYLEGARNDPFDKSQFVALLDRALTRLRNDDHLDRLCSPFVCSAMPELWNDPVAYSDFGNSFFGYLEYMAQRPGRGSRVPGAILKRVGFRDGEIVNADAIKRALAKRLTISGWTDDDW